MGIAAGIARIESDLINCDDSKTPTLRSNSSIVYLAARGARLDMLGVAVQNVFSLQRGGWHQGRPFSLERSPLTPCPVVPLAPSCHTPAVTLQYVLMYPLMYPQGSHRMQQHVHVNGLSCKCTSWACLTSSV